ncbi:transglutaminase family protein [Pelagicoccus sp. SDUM812005]|uniref:transglutaminase family protein n=1 Tax=Pelagicoccus sp. SDUM812005 TaxID=3041257 RepID=UPI00280F00CB|nr:transglutaminase family protein [Pelagicoccus sp. SDUM812005]MDQ8180773.1 transglutaminase family protein [Pelagicoccus sp. SDUM812005]
MRLKISHRTRYQYNRPVQLNPHLLYLRPRENPLQSVNAFRMDFQPAARVDWMRDDFDNLPASAHFETTSDVLDIHAHCQVTTSDLGPFDFLVRDYATRFPFQYEPLHKFNLGIYLKPPEPPVRQALNHWLQQRFPKRPQETVTALFELNRVIQQSIAYQRRDDIGIQSATTTLSLGTGSCRDFAALFIECARTLGIAARFVSGYLFDPTLNAQQAGDMHAWAEVFLPGAGWRGLDPTHGIFCDNAYIPVAHAVVAESVNPVQGSFFSNPPANDQLFSDVRVQRLD